MKKYCLLASLLLSSLCTTAFAQTYTDGFEGAFISSFWTPLRSGTATLTNSIAHSGSQSLQLSNSSGDILLHHDFGGEQTGSVSVWVSGNCCRSGIEVNSGT